MVVGIFGESCTGKSTLADALKAGLNAAAWTGRDYLRLAKSESEAKRAFQTLLQASQTPIVCVMTEKDDLALLPKSCFRVLATASIDTIQTRFAARMHGNLPPPLMQMLQKKHGMFDDEPIDFRFDSDTMNADTAADEIVSLLGRK